MKRIIYVFVFMAFLSVILINCKKEDELTREPLPKTFDFSQLEIEDFIWQGLNLYYLWKDNVPDLDDSKIEDTETYFNLLNRSESPEVFFESLLYDTENVDVYSWIVDDYVTLENSFVGVIKTHGVRYKLYLECAGCSTLIGVVRYILPDSDASDKDVLRGYVFNAIDGTELTLSNYQELLGRDSYTMSFADITDGGLVSNGKSVDLVQEENFVENPFHVVKTFDIDGLKIGYILYNGFDGDFENEMNEAFSQIKSSGATELILDLRYNGGGYSYVSNDMATAITGQFNGEIISKDRYNSSIQAFYEENYPNYIIDRFSSTFANKEMAITSLNLTKLYVITTSSTASASELLISGLRPYIDVTTIGSTTYGKYTGSRTLYDSADLSKSGDNFNTNHTYAMQPIILEYTNKNGETVKGGLAPNVEKIEYISEFGPLGDPTEPLLAETLALITGSGKPAASKKGVQQFKQFNSIFDFDQKGNGVLIKKELPKGLFKRKK